MIVAILIGRAGSEGLRGKNLRPLLGRPLMLYPLLAALNCPLVERVYVSTDDHTIKSLAEERGCAVIDRPAELCTSQALGEDVFVHAYQEVKRRLQDRAEELEALALLMCNAPTVLPGTISAGVKALREDPAVDSAVTVSRYNMWSPLRARKVGPDGLLQPMVPFASFADPATLNCDRDCQGDVWFADMGLSLVRPRCLEHLDQGVLPQKWMGQKIYPLKQWGGCDVDYEWQLPGLEFWLRSQGFSEEQTPYDAGNANPV